MSRRFDAAEEWLKRRDGRKQYHQVAPESCSACKPRDPATRHAYRRSTIPGSTGSKYRVSPTKCWQRSGHVGYRYGLRGVEVIAAANVILKFRTQGGRDYFARLEADIERMIAVELRLRPRTSITGTAMVRIIRRLIKNEPKSVGRSPGVAEPQVLNA